MNYKWNVIHTHNADSYSDTDSENLHVILSNQWCSLIVVKVSQGVANTQFIDEKTRLRKFVIFADNSGSFSNIATT